MVNGICHLWKHRVIACWPFIICGDILVVNAWTSDSSHWRLRGLINDTAIDQEWSIRSKADESVPENRWLLFNRRLSRVQDVFDMTENLRSFLPFCNAYQSWSDRLESFGIGNDGYCLWFATRSLNTVVPCSQNHDPWCFLFLQRNNRTWWLGSTHFRSSA